MTTTVRRRYTLGLVLALALWACGDPAAETDGQTATDATVETDVLAPDGDGGDTGGDTVIAPAALGWCSYTNPFSARAECKAYTGAGWTSADAQADCAAVFQGTAGTFSADQPCDLPQALGRCYAGEADGRSVVVQTAGDAAEDCRIAGTGCDLFHHGRFVPGTPCEATVPYGKGAFGSTPFVQPYRICRAPAEGDPAGHGPDGQVCAWSVISGCTEPGRRFDEDASCADVLTQRPYYAAPNEPQTAADDPRLQDAAYMAEVDWARQQVEACGCVCCHSTRASKDGAVSWYVEASPIWLDSITDSGLALMAGYADSSALGAFPPDQNNGFNRTDVGLPTTDVARMATLMKDEYARRGFTPADGRAVTPFGGPIYAQLVYEPQACKAGQGLDEAGNVVWTGGSARYVYVLEGDAANPGVPPNLDQPEGTLWRVEVPFFGDPFASGLPYGQPSSNVVQVSPETGSAPALVPGQTYYLVVLRDVGIPLVRCLFTAP